MTSPRWAGPRALTQPGTQATRARPFIGHYREQGQAHTCPCPLGDDSSAGVVTSKSQDWALEKNITWEGHPGSESGKGLEFQQDWGMGKTS